MHTSYMSYQNYEISYNIIGKFTYCKKNIILRMFMSDPAHFRCGVLEYKNSADKQIPENSCAPPANLAKSLLRYLSYHSICESNLCLFFSVLSLLKSPSDQS